MQLDYLASSGVYLLAQNVAQLSETQIRFFEQTLNQLQVCRVGKFRFEEDRLRSLVAFGLRNEGLRKLLDIELDALAFDVGPHGKPRLADSMHSQIEFNASHSGDWVVVGFSNRPIGVDVESCGRQNDIRAIASRYYHGAELEQLLASGSQFRDHFFDLWTLKESYMKARGDGLSLGLGNFGFLRQANGCYQLEVSQALKDSNDNWDFLLHSPDSTHRLAVSLSKSVTDADLSGSKKEPKIEVFYFDSCCEAVKLDSFRNADFFKS